MEDIEIPEDKHHKGKKAIAHGLVHTTEQQTQNITKGIHKEKNPVSAVRKCNNVASYSP